MAKISTSDTPSLGTGMLSFTRSIQITEGRFFATSSKDDMIRTPIEVMEKGVRGQSSEDNADNPGLSNLQSVEYAMIPQDHDGAELSFSIRVMPFSIAPCGCDSASVRETYKRLAESYGAAGGYSVLAELYAWNIANARFAWRNRFQSDAMSVTVHFDNTEIVFDPLVRIRIPDEQPLVDHSGLTLKQSLVQGDADDLHSLVDGIARGLFNPDKRAFVADIRWNAKMNPGQEIFPSQEYVRDERKDKQISRIYAKLLKQVGNRTVAQASMHSQKIGAALRHIDIWHDSDEHDGAIAVNPHGGIQDTGKVLRNGPKSFYALRRNAAALLENVEQAKSRDDISGDVHFVMANLVRGGVFGSAKKKPETKA